MPSARSKPKAPVKKPRGEGAGDWRDQTLARVRAMIVAAVPSIVEERKWKKPSNGMRGVPVWSCAGTGRGGGGGGIVCTGETYKNCVKLTFARGASLPDPSGLFNASLEGGTRRAIDIREGETVPAGAFKALVKAAAAACGGSRTPGTPKRGRAGVVLLSGGNPQIAKADGDAPVRAYIDAMSGGGPGWKRDIGRRLDALIVKAVPGVRKAVKWNSAFYGVEGSGWFVSFHVFTRYVKVGFFRGTSLRPLPPGGTSKSGETRYLDIREGDELDEGCFASWVKQAAALPGWEP